MGLEGDLQMSQFDLKDWWVRETNFTRRADEPVARPYSVLQCVFLLQRHTGYFLIQVSRAGGERRIIVRSQVYLPCALIVILSWVGFWLNREATSDRVTLGERQSLICCNNCYRRDCGAHPLRHLHGQPVRPAQGSLRHRAGLVHHLQLPLLPCIHT